MVKLFFSPHFPKGTSLNPYCDNYIESIGKLFSIVSTPTHLLPKGLNLLRGSFRADVYILNWIEAVVHLRYGTINALLAILALYIIHLRKKKIIWMFHNVHPHGGETYLSNVIQKLLFSWSNMIVSHSREASDYAKQFAKCPVYYRPHPFKSRVYSEYHGNIIDCDLFIWGDIYPYKGVVEFLSNPTIRNSNTKVYILGRCLNEKLTRQIENCITSNVIFDNRRADYDEIAAQCKASKYVLFPYIGNSISSSGVLMDTLQMGGIPIGPDKGAFKDLKEAGCCITYDNIEDVVGYVQNENREIFEVNVNNFININTWEEFGNWVYNKFKNDIE